MKYFIPTYVEAFCQENKTLLIINNLNEAQILLEQKEYIDEYIDIEENGCNNLLTELKQVLYEQEILIDDEIQNKIYKQIKEEMKDILFLTIMPTESCNFRCLYCYESHSFNQMTLETINGIKNFINNMIKERKFKFFQISWFGGEPTLCPNIIEDINTYVKNIALKLKAEFSSSIVTNAYNLTTDIFLRLLNVEVKFYQITIDGFQHDKYRFLKNGQPTLQKIINNLDEISNLDKNIDFKILIRNNIMANNREFEWYDFLKEKFGHETRFEYSVVPVAKLGGENDHKFEIIEDNTEIIEEHFNYMDKIGLPISRQITSHVSSGVCYAALPYGFVIRENGDINKCTIALNSDLNRVGKLYSDHYILFKEKEFLWKKNRFFGKCKKCRSGLVCLNKACPFRLIDNGLRRKCIYDEEKDNK